MTTPANVRSPRAEPIGWAAFRRIILEVIFLLGAISAVAPGASSQSDNGLQRPRLAEALGEFRGALGMLETRQTAVARALIAAQPQQAQVEQAFANLRASVEDSRMALQKLESLLRAEFGSRGAEVEAVMDSALRAYDAWISLDADYDRLIANKLSVVWAIQRSRAVWEAAEAELAKLVGPSP